MLARQGLVPLCRPVTGIFEIGSLHLFARAASNHNPPDRSLPPE
jgi:hypothetical protein